MFISRKDGGYSRPVVWVKIGFKMKLSAKKKRSSHYMNVVNIINKLDSIEFFESIRF